MIDIKQLVRRMWKLWITLYIQIRFERNLWLTLFYLLFLYIGMVLTLINEIRQ